MSPVYFFILTFLLPLKLWKSMAITILLSAAVVQSRLGLGVHSVNQVLFGYILGLSATLVFIGWGYEQFYKYMLKVYNNKV